MAFQILIVDDSAPMRAVIKKTIKAAGVAAGFGEAEDGHQALNVLREGWYDLVITDFNMPGMDGMGLIAAMQQDEMLRSIPVLVVTTEGSRERIAAFIAQGATDYVKKPFTPETIRQKLVEMLGEPDDTGNTQGGSENSPENSIDDFDF